MKKKFNILVALVCVIALGFAGCSVADAIIDWLEQLIQAAKSDATAVGGQIQDTDDLTTNGEPQEPTPGAYYIKIYNDFNATTGEMTGYIYFDNDNSYIDATETDEMDPDDITALLTEDKYKFVLKMATADNYTSTYTFTLENEEGTAYVANKNISGDGYGLKGMASTTEKSEAAYIQMWEYDGDNYLVLINGDNTLDDNKNIYMYYNTRSTPPVRWWETEYKLDSGKTFPVRVTLEEVK